MKTTWLIVLFVSALGLNFPLLAEASLFSRPPVTVIVLILNNYNN